MKINKDVFMGVLGGVVVFVGGFAVHKFKKLSKKIEDISNAVDDASEKIDLTVPEDIVKVAMTKAAKRECAKVASVEALKVAKDISKKVDETLSSAYQNVEDDLKKQLEEKISMSTLDNIEKSVANKVSKRILNNPLFSFGKVNDVCDVIRSCTEAGMTAYDISRILKSMGFKGE